VLKDGESTFDDHPSDVEAALMAISNAGPAVRFNRRVLFATEKRKKN